MARLNVAAEPLAVWDATGRGWWQEPAWREASAWAQDHFPRRAINVYRADFYLVDVPFVVLYQYDEDEQGRAFVDPATGDAAVIAPVTLILPELPPEHLRKQIPQQGGGSAGTVTIGA